MITREVFDKLQSRAVAAGYDPEVLSGAHVLVVGAGALGQNVLLDLALTGVRRLTLVDADRFEDHNLTRSPLYDREAVAADPDPAKARLCAHELVRHVSHPEAEIRYADSWIEDLGDAAFEDVDVVVSAVDSPRARLYLARMAMVNGLPLIEGGFSGTTLHLGVYPSPGDGQDVRDIACWACQGLPDDIDVAFPCGRTARAVGTAGIVPALQNGAATLGGLQAEAVITTLHGSESRARRVQLDLRTLEAVNAGLRADLECGARHRRDDEAHPSALGPDASADAVIATTLGDEVKDAALTVPRPFVFVGECHGCRALLDVRAPSHRVLAQPRCGACGGPWPVADPDTWPGMLSPIRTGSAEAGAPLAHFGVVGGDRVTVVRDDRSVRVRLAGRPDWSLVRP